MFSRLFSGKNWQWSADFLNSFDISDKHLEIVYRLDTEPNCSYGSCKCRSSSNNASNIWCLNGLGEKRIAQCLIKEPNNSLLSDRNSLFRKSDEYVGLTNLGATCYINAYFQVWYHNVLFRENILGIKLEKMQFESPTSEDDLEFRVKSHECLATNLQLLFTLMKETVRKSINPAFFVKAIGLDTSEQQDAQEFSQLFLTILQNTFSSASLNEKNTIRFPISSSTMSRFSSSSNLINDLFQGECSYITQCQKCKFESVRNSNFIELSLNIQNSKDIIECIQDLLKEELLEDDNKYHCSQCNSKQNASRHMKLSRLPPVLNLQLLRFVYDRKTGCKKKLSSKIKFYEDLDLSQYAKSGEPAVYQLGAILMHVGKTAYSGHYTAQIRDFTTNEWNGFNDQIITKIKKKQQLGCTEEELESSSSAVTTKALSQDEQSQSSSSLPCSGKQKGALQPESGFKSSKAFSTANAYLLVYYRTDLIKKADSLVSQEKICELSNQSEVIRLDNLRLEKWAKQVDEKAMATNESQFAERSIRHSIYENLWVNSAPNVEFNDAMRKFSEQKFEKDLKLISEERSISNLVDYPIRDPESVNKASRLDPSSDYYFLPTEVIRKILDLKIEIDSKSNSTTDQNSCEETKLNLGPNTITKYICGHNRLNPFAINKFKVVSRSGLDLLKAKLKIEWNSFALPVYNTRTTLCFECVQVCLEFLRLRETLKIQAKNVRTLLQIEFNQAEVNRITKSKQHYENENDVLIIEDKTSSPPLSDQFNRLNNNQLNATLKNGQDDSKKNRNYEDESNNGRKLTSLKANNKNQGSIKWYWAGRESLKQWQSLALKRIERRLPPIKFDNSTIETGGGGDDDSIQDNEVEILNEASYTASNSLRFFNEDIVCLHGQLSTTSAKRLIHSNLFEIFNDYFSEDQNFLQTVEFTNSTNECPDCLRSMARQADHAVQLKVLREQLNTLYLNENRPNLDAFEPKNEASTQAITYYLVANEFITEWRSIVRSGRYKPIQIRNASLICTHSRLVKTSLKDVTLLEGIEWFTLIGHYNYDVEITVIRSNETGILEYTPNVCETCIAQQKIDELMFKNKKIYVRTTEEDTSPEIIMEEDQTQSGEVSKRPIQLLDDLLEDDPPTMKRKRLIEKNEADWLSQNNKNSSKQSSRVVLSSSTSLLNGAEGPRRSTRQRGRHKKDDIAIDASSTETIKDIKKKIASKTAKLVSEQRLYYEGLELNNEKLLIDYKIKSGDMLTLKIDKPTILDEETDSQVYTSSYMPEIGFKGTNLLK